MVAELGLQIALLADEQWHHRVAVVLVDVECLGNHREEPAVEILWPVFKVGGQATGEVLDVIALTIPMVAAGEELVDGVVISDVSAR